MTRRPNTWNTEESSNTWRHIAVVGGTFDPPHYGHVSLIDAAFEDLSCNEVIVRPSNGNPLKSDSKTDFRHRIEMCQLLLGDRSNVAICDYEQSLAYPTYSYRTAFSMFVEEYGPAYYHFLIGEDCVKDLPRWKNLVEMFAFADIYAVGANVSQVRNQLPPWIRRNMGYVEKPLAHQVHSTEIRSQISSGVFDPTNTSQNVLDYIQQNSLYQEK